VSQIKVGVVEEVFIGLAYGGLACKVVTVHINHLMIRHLVTTF